MVKKVDDKTLLALCLTGRTQTQIARELGMTKAAICRRVNTDDFKKMLSDYRKRILDGVLTELTANTQKSVQTLVQLLDNKNPFVQLQSACKILSLSQEYGIQNDLLHEIDKIKQIQEEQQL